MVRSSAVQNLKIAGQQVMLDLRQRISIMTGYNLGYPSNIYVATTHHCNFRCKMCHNWMMKKSPELPDKEMSKLLQRLFNWLPAGVKINFSGGEPFARQGFLDLLESLEGREAFLIGITTNAFLIDDERARKMMALGLFNINISLDSPNSEVHDYLRGRKGAFDRVIRAIEELSYWKKQRGMGTHIIIKTIINEKNIQELGKLLHIVYKYELQGVYFQPLEHTFGEEPDDKWYEKSELWPRDIPEVTEALRALVTLKSKGAPIINSTSHLVSMIEYFRNPLTGTTNSCSIGHRTLFIWPDGSVYLCPDYGAVGNFAIDDPGKVWDSKRAAKMRNALAKCKKKCLLTCQVQTSLLERARAFLALGRKRT